MADPGSRAGSSIWRRGASASGRLTEGLLSSNGTVATVGLLSAIVTLVFAIWFGLELRYQSQTAAPLARQAAVMNAELNRSLAALRGWVAYGRPEARAQRRAIWAEEIEPTQAELERLAKRSRDPAVAEQIAHLGEVLRALKIVQWSIEDVAHTPGNEPAAVAYEMRLRPLRTSLLRSLRESIDQYSMTNSGERSIDFVANLARFRSSISRTDLALSAYLDDYSEVRERATLGELELARSLAAKLAVDVQPTTDGDLEALLLFALDEFVAYELQAQEVVAMRRASELSVAQLLYVEEGQPLVQEARATASLLAASQAEATAERSHDLTRASVLVMALATLMGALSAGSLFVSFRLQRQIRNVLERAKTLGQYEIEKRIGKGGMGEVYLAHHAMLRRPTAIKLLRAESAQDLRAQQRFQREVQLTSQLTHPNTIEIFDYGRTPQGIFYYAMEYVQGFTIESLVQSTGPVPPGRVVHALAQACGSLQEAHDQGLLHRDIKPSNIMLTRRGGVCDTVKILDFGLVKDLSGNEAIDDEEDVIAGTPMYLAPETILSSSSSSPQSDLYALAAVAYYMLCGHAVFETNDVREILHQQLREMPPFPSQRLGAALPEDLEYVVMSCLAKDPADRPASAAKLAELLRACEVEPWADDDAVAWWSGYAEALLTDGTVSAGSSMASGVEVVVAESRS